jgi:hypothetical protein
MIFSVAFCAPSLGFMEITNFQACLSPILARPSVGLLMNGESLAEIISEINFPELKELRVFDCEESAQILCYSAQEREDCKYLPPSQALTVCAGEENLFATAQKI